jgi:tetratricopeptide (TPR) repeat protein
MLQLGWALSLAGFVGQGVFAQTTSQAPSIGPVAAAVAETPAVVNSQLDAELFFNILLGELNLLDDEPRTAYALLLDSAIKTGDGTLFQRTVNIALQSRAGDLALTAARAWRVAVPESVDAARYIVQILIALNRTDLLQKALEDYLSLSFNGSNAATRDAALSSVADIFSRATNKTAAALMVEQALASHINNPSTAVTAWITLGRLRLAAGDSSGALDAARKAQTLQGNAPEPALLALALMGPKAPLAESIVKQYLGTPENRPKPEIRLLYARTLLTNARFNEALAQALKLSQDAPDFAQGWLVLGSLQYQNSQDHQDSKALAAQASLTKFIQLAWQLPEEQRNPGMSRAYLLLSQIAENNNDFEAAKAWLAKIDSSDDAFSIQNRQASLLAKQGKLDEALQLLVGFPESSAEHARLKASAQAQLLRDNKQYQRAYDVLATAVAQITTKSPHAPELSDLHYDLAMLAEKLDRLDDMERLLRLVITAKPEHHHAYNALGYSLAERSIRLPEAKLLIQKAVQLAPEDPFIADSLGWVEFRLGNLIEAESILTAAFKSKPDAEIAAHLGEVLWSQGRKTEAIALWKTGLTLNPGNDTLVETLKRLGVKP